ncbi:MAG: exodeoxyribonuclease VII large subunit [Rhodocyclaceae bacterium]|nr:exodeoxyribonuclease VII large subunit [Rhodocyclaceae bacterium]
MRAMPASNSESDLRRALTVSELNEAARRVLELEFPVLWVAGEIAGLSRPSSGHLYFTLKDAGAQVRCAMFRNRAQLLPFRLQDGRQVEVRAQLTLYEARGDYQLVVEAVREAGAGAMFEALARLKARLLAEGLFESSRKRALPALPCGIAVVTSLQAAALQDVLAALARRAPALAVFIYPCPVQGVAATPRIVEALARAGADPRCEAILLVRGGGSIEDLWCFNEEPVVRAIAAAKLPVVAGVGHETDVTLADFAADMRAATPTAAAELVSAGYLAAAARLRSAAERLPRLMARALGTRMQALDLLASRLIGPRQLLARKKLQRTELAARLARAAAATHARAQHRLALAAARLRAPTLQAEQTRLVLLQSRLRTAMTRQLDSQRARLRLAQAHIRHLDPRAALARGYSIARNAQGDIVRDAATLAAGGELSIEFAHGQARAQVFAIEPADVVSPASGA